MPATDLPAASFEQDFVLGHHVGVQGKEVPALLDSEPASGCQTCKDLFPHGSRFLAHVCEEHPDYSVCGKGRTVTCTEGSCCATAKDRAAKPKRTATASRRSSARPQGDRV